MSKKTAKIPRFSQAVRFLRVSRLLLWTIWVIYRERRRVIRAHEKGNYEVQPNVEVLIKVLVAFRQTAIKLGVLMIKLGQFLSSRADLLPEEALAVLASLQDEVPAEPFSHVVSVIEEELGKPIEHIFSYVEHKATAAASLGQVHPRDAQRDFDKQTEKQKADLDGDDVILWHTERVLRSGLPHLRGLSVLAAR
jgi:predicted unusual protein kinase regulating ubiquinone biosynthesis (AarF/ABC1/UbiB family)